MRVLGDKQILKQGRVLEEFDVLERSGDAKTCDLVWRDARNVDAIENKIAARGLIDSTDQVEDCCLSCPVRPDDREYLPLVDIKCNAIDGLDAPEIDGKVVYLEHRHCSRSVRM